MYVCVRACVRATARESRSESRVTKMAVNMSVCVLLTVLSWAEAFYLPGLVPTNFCEKEVEKSMPKGTCSVWGVWHGLNDSLKAATCFSVE